MWQTTSISVKLLVIAWFSFECQKVKLLLHFLRLTIGLKNLRQFLSNQNYKKNCDVYACIFLLFTSATCNYFAFWLVQCIVCVLCDWLGLQLLFWFYETWLKITLSILKIIIIQKLTMYSTCSIQFLKMILSSVFSKQNCRNKSYPVWSTHLCIGVYGLWWHMTQ